MRRRFFVIHNPRAGGASRNRLDAVLERLRAAGATIQVTETARHGAARQAAAEGARGGFDAVVAAGGDGTVHDAAEGLLGHDVPLGVVPLGTANVFAREIGLPSTAPGVAATLLDGPAAPLPLGRIDGRPFLFVVGVGFDAAAVRHFEQAGQRGFGRAGLAWPVLRALSSYEDTPLRVTTDGGTSVSSWVIVTRTPHYAGDLLLAPRADLGRDDFHVIHFRAAGRLARLRHLAALAAGLVPMAPGIEVERTRRVRIEGRAEVPVQVDGEMLGALPLEIAPHPLRLSLIRPAA